MSYEHRRAEIERLTGLLPDAESEILRRFLDKAENSKSLDLLLDKIEGIRCKMDFKTAIRCMGLVSEVTPHVYDFLTSLDYAMTDLPDDKKKRRLAELSAATAGSDLLRKVQDYLKKDSGRYGSVSEDRSRTVNPHKVHYKL